MGKCRACLSTEDSMFLMDENFMYNYNLLTSLDVKTSDDMSHVVCQTCFQAVRFFIEFREKCTISEASLRSINKDVKLETKPGLLPDIKVELFETDYEYLEPLDFNDDINLIIKKEEEEEINIANEQHSRSRCKKKNKPATLSQQSCDIQLFCGICPKAFIERSKLVAHLEDHKTSKSCYLCPQLLRGWAHLLGHRITHLPKNQKTCHICSKRFQTSVGLEYHFRKSHLNEKNIRLACDICPNSFDSARKVRKHIWAIHSNTNYICDYCGKIYSNKHTLRVHIRCHLDIKMYVCNICNFSCKHSGGLKDHMIRRHIDKKVNCKECKRVFESQEKCDKHNCNTKPPAICTVCGVELKRGVRLTRHMDTHKPVGRFKCTRCPKVYKARGALAVHLRKHDGDRNLRCEFCPATFYYPSALGKHRRIHTGEKPYVCKICDRGFTGNHNLKVHMKVHGEFNLIMRKVKREDIEA